MLVELHLVLAVLVAGCGALAALVAGFGMVTGRTLRFARDRAILAAVVLVLVGVASGLALLATGGAPDDPLHLLYAVAVLLPLPVARFWDRLAGHRAISVGVAGLLTVALVVRLFQTS
jgi:hypothetical protein